MAIKLPGIYVAVRGGYDQLNQYTAKPKGVKPIFYILEELQC